MIPVVHMDKETRSTCDLRLAGSDVYSKDTSTEVLCVSIQTGDMKRPSILSPRKVPLFIRTKTGLSMEECITVAHNVRFEYDMWRNCCVKKYGWPPPKVENLRCTMVKSYVVGLPGSLDMASAAAGMQQRKDQKGKRIMMQLCQPKEWIGDTPIWYEPKDYPEKFEELYKYCQQDGVVEDVLDKKLPNLSAYEKRVWELDQKINDRGVRIDIKAARVAKEIVESEKERLNETIHRVSGKEVMTVTAHAQIAAFLKRREIETKKVDKPHVRDLLKKLRKKPEKYKQVIQVLELRQQGGKSSVAKFKTMVDSADGDRIRGILQYHGAATGRWAGRKIQTHNLPRPKISKDDIEHVFEVLHG